MTQLRKRIAAPAALVVFGLLAACETQPEAESELDAVPAQEMTVENDDPMVRAEMDEATDAWLSAEAADDGMAAAELYADDAHFVGSTGMVEGQQAIAQMWEQAFDAQPGSAGTTLEILKWGSSGDLSYALGRYTNGMTSPTGHYLLVSRQMEDGTWKVVAQVSVADPEE